MIETDRFVQVEVASRAEWRAWLNAHHAQDESVWAVTYLKSDPVRYVSRFELLDEALCFGWIDGLRRKLDEIRTMQLFSPRRHQRWTATYRARVERLIEAGHVMPAGFAAIDASKVDGSWLAMPDVDALLVPDDLRVVLLELPAAGENFAAFSPSSRRNMLRWLASARTPTTRLARIRKIAAAAGRNEKIPLM